MRSTLATTLTALLTALALAGCGSGGTKTVSASSGVGAERGNTTTSASTGTTSTRATTKTEPAPKTAPQTTRTATAPAFTKEPSGSEGLSQATATVKAHGYTPNDTAQYHPGQTLRVLLATRTGSAGGNAQQAFFFVDGRYIGTDTAAPSAGIRLVSQSDTETTIAYRLYRPSDALCCARGGEATVHFQLNNGHLVALDPIPPVSSSTGASRR